MTLQLAADHDDVIETFGRLERSARQNGKAAARPNRAPSRCHDLPLTKEVTAEVKLITRDAQRFKKPCEREQREVRKEQEAHAELKNRSVHLFRVVHDPTPFFIEVSAHS